MIRVILILFLLISPANAKCKYYAEADVVNDKLINKKEKYTCKENDNFIRLMIIVIIIINLIRCEVYKISIFPFLSDIFLLNIGVYWSNLSRHYD